MNYEIIQLNANTWRIENGFVRLFLLTGTEKAILLDTGANLPEAKQIAETLTALPLALYYTHGDGDHVSGTAAFSEFHIHPADHKNCKLGERFPESKLVPIEDGETIDLGGRTVEMIHIPGHTYGSVAFIDNQDRVLYSGDSVQDGHVFMFGAHRDPSSFSASLEKLIAMESKFDTVYACHGKPQLPGSYVRTVRDAWAKVLAGELEPREEQLHGNTVLTYEGDGCGFYCNAK